MKLPQGPQREPNRRPNEEEEEAEEHTVMEISKPQRPRRVNESMVPVASRELRV